MYFKKFFFVVLFINFFTQIEQGFSSENLELEVRYITPPQLEDAYLGEKILCHRPLREGAPAMFVEDQGAQLVVHNYGHGGSGWTLGPGASQYVVDLLRQKMPEKNYTLTTPITVVGAGALGLFTSFELIQQGFKNIQVVAKAFEALTSHNAGGLLAPVSMNTSLEMQSLIDKIGIDAYKFFKMIAQGQHPVLKTGAKITPTYFESRQDSGLEPYVGQVMQPAKDVILDFKNGTRRQMVAYDDGIFINTSGLMQALKEFLTNKVTFVQQNVRMLQDIQTPIIMNCTGLGAKELVNDSKMTPVQGHLILLKNQNPEDIDYMALRYLDTGKTSIGKDIKRSFYIFPKSTYGAFPRDIGVIGGTFIQDAGPDTPHEEEFRYLLENAKRFYGLDV